MFVMTQGNMIDVEIQKVFLILKSYFYSLYNLDELICLCLSKKIHQCFGFDAILLIKMCPFFVNLNSINQIRLYTFNSKF